ncbi:MULTISPECIES: EAL domain-containing protein [Bacillus]|uniref:EAL domain-containing protein n=1 Tax=Bacillus TaxID=1386 RepID=UPI000314CDC3|nr:MULTISPECIES: EAL-associated domain-containing protein [Bacillus]
MDAMEVLTNLESLQPYFQPIFSADEHVVIGYEILGRYVYDSDVVSLGTFFHDETIPEEYRIDVDNRILELALEKLMNEDGDFLIFINRDPNLLMLDYGEDFLEIVKKYVSENEMSRIVIELSEKKFAGDLESLHHLLSYYKTYGIKIAIDHLGGDNHLDRISLLSPHILKVNLEQLKSQGWNSQKDIISSLGIIARKNGATLLYESIETVYQLQFAWRNGGRYYQGFYLAEPNASLIEKELLKDRFRQECHSFITSEKKNLEQKFNTKKKLQEDVQNIIQKIKITSSDYSELHDLAVMLEHYAFRLYICDEDGFQKSPNIFKKEGNWLVQNEYKSKNWSWRPYFLKTIIKMRNDQKGELSDSYSDIETGETIRTFSIPLNENDYLFVDISYDYLYEHDIF